MLDAVLAHAQRQGWASAPGFSRKTVRWAIHLTDDGMFAGFTALGDGKEGMPLDRCPHLTQGQLVSGGETRSQFLIESLQTVLLHCKEDIEQDERDKMLRKHGYFAQLAAEAATELPRLAGVAAFLADEAQRHQALEKVQATTPKPKPTDAVTFYIAGSLVSQPADWHEWWRRLIATLGSKPAQDKELSKRKNAKKAVASAPMICVLTGDQVTPAPTHGAKIKGLAGVGGLGTGDVMVGFDKAAFQSYGLDDSRNAATSDETATAYAEALSRLIAENSVKIGDALAVYWFGRDLPKEDDPIAVALAAAGDEDAAGDGGHAARRVLLAIQQGIRANALDNEYHSLVVSGASGRVMVRHYQAGQLETLAAAVCRWFDDLAIVHREGGALASAPKFMAVIGAMFRELKDAPARFIVPLWLSAIHGQPIPREALSKALLRIRTDILNDKTASHARMGLLKAFHIRNLGDTDMKPHLNEEHPAPAYHCGRWLAVFANLQHAALGDVGAGVVQRYYGAVSQAPALHLGRLVHNAKNHLGKLEPGLAFWFEERIAEIASRIGDAAPRTLTLEQQSLFALGYYQQLAQLRVGKGGKTASDASATTQIN